MSVRRVVMPGQRRLACNACSVAFEDAADHREHHRGEWHRLNLKRKLGGLAPLSLENFEAMPIDARVAALAVDT
jgi:pre-60S factor REI1